MNNQPLRPLTKHERRVRVPMSFCAGEYYPSRAEAVLRIHAGWSDHRKKQPIYEVSLDVGAMKQLALELAQLVKEHERQALLMTSAVREVL